MTVKLKHEFYNYRLANDDDKDQVLALLNGVFEEQQRSAVDRDTNFWNWKYKNNPFGESYLTVVENEKDIVCVGNLWPWEFLWRGRILRALQPCDSAVHPEYRGLGLFSRSRIKSVKMAMDNDSDFFFNFPNENSLPSYQALGWHYMGQLKWQVKVLKPLNIVKGKLYESKSEVLPIPDELRIDANLLDSIAKRRITFDSVLKINRIDGFHNWRYLEHPTRVYGMVVDKDIKPTIAAVFTINQKGLNRELVIVDLIGDSSNLTYLIKEVIHIAKDLNVDFIALIKNKYFNTNELWKYGFITKKLKNMVVLPLLIGMENELTDPNKWDISATIHDSI